MCVCVHALCASSNILINILLHLLGYFNNRVQTHTPLYLLWSRQPLGWRDGPTIPKAAEIHYVRTMCTRCPWNYAEDDGDGDDGAMIQFGDRTECKERTVIT